jgi:heme/copper-type cytochrome/quinol oxidase subunit 4
MPPLLFPEKKRTQQKQKKQMLGAFFACACVVIMLAGACWIFHYDEDSAKGPSFAYDGI